MVSLTLEPEDLAAGAGREERLLEVSIL
jgi:hypothetical protein